MKGNIHLVKALFSTVTCGNTGYVINSLPQNWLRNGLCEEKDSYTSQGQHEKTLRSLTGPSFHRQVHKDLNSTLVHQWRVNTSNFCCLWGTTGEKGRARETLPVTTHTNYLWSRQSFLCTICFCTIIWELNSDVLWWRECGSENEVEATILCWVGVQLLLCEEWRSHCWHNSDKTQVINF